MFSTIEKKITLISLMLTLITLISTCLISFVFSYSMLVADFTEKASSINCQQVLQIKSYLKTIEESSVIVLNDVNVENSLVNNGYNGDITYALHNIRALNSIIQGVYFYPAKSDMTYHLAMGMSVPTRDEILTNDIPYAFQVSEKMSCGIIRKNVYSVYSSVHGSRSNVSYPNIYTIVRKIYGDDKFVGYLLIDITLNDIYAMYKFDSNFINQTEVKIIKDIDKEIQAKVQNKKIFSEKLSDYVYVITEPEFHALNKKFFWFLACNILISCIFFWLFFRALKLLNSSITIPLQTLKSTISTKIFDDGDGNADESI